MPVGQTDRFQTVTLHFSLEAANIITDDTEEWLQQEKDLQ